MTIIILTSGAFFAGCIVGFIVGAAVLALVIFRDRPSEDEYHLAAGGGVRSNTFNGPQSYWGGE